MSAEAKETSSNIDPGDVAYAKNLEEDGPKTGIPADLVLDPSSAIAFQDTDNVPEHVTLHLKAPEGRLSHGPLNENYSGTKTSELNCNSVLCDPQGASSNIEDNAEVDDNTTYLVARENDYNQDTLIKLDGLLENTDQNSHSTFESSSTKSTDMASNIRNNTEILQNRIDPVASSENDQDTLNKLENDHLDALISLDNNHLNALSKLENSHHYALNELENSKQNEHSNLEFSVTVPIKMASNSPAIDHPENEESILNSKLGNTPIDGSDSQSRHKLSTSTTSLNDQTAITETNVSLSKSSHSKSVENISSPSTNDLNSICSTKDLNTEKILLDFSSQKPKVTATQKLTEVPHTPDTNPTLDVRYGRIPKELLSQDIGSIVKNVHGIFSSVSGSLKNAYNHSQRATTKPTTKIVKPIPNGKLMNDIFEEEKPIEQNQIQNQNEEEKPNLTNSKIESTIEQNINAGTAQMRVDVKTDVLKLQVETLERVLAEQRKENSSLRERVRQQGVEMQEKDQAFTDLETKLDAMAKRVDTAERDKDAAVMRYASVECAAIEARRAAERSAQAERSALSEVELMSTKLRSAHSEKQRICQLYDDKCHELSTSERELAKVREDVKELEGRLKWTQSKLRVEMDAYKESTERVEKLSQRVCELEAARDATTANAVDAARVKQLESELAESQAALILCRHERDGLEQRVPALTRQLRETERDRDTWRQQAESAREEVSVLVAANSALQQEAAELAALRAQAALAHTLQERLQRETERATQAEASEERERARADTCARREAAALEHGARLEARHLQAAAAAETAMAKAQALEVDNAALRSRASALESERDALTSSLREESERRDRENRVLARKVAELTEELTEANKRLEWEKGENDVLKKKHANAIKELNRELLRALKRCDQLEAKRQTKDEDRTESVSSLSSGECALEESSRQLNGHTDAVPDIQVREPDRQALIERIVSLQRAAARRAERSDFLEEHCRQLTAELRKKSRVLRSLLCAMPAGAVASEDSDAHKKEIARLGGGAMAAVWGGDPNGMTLELSLEMNQRLQAVLEDALLKNITLKENMDTLGEEISKLKAQKGQ